MRDILDFSGTGKDGENTYGHDFNVNAGVMTRDTWQFLKQYNNGGKGLASFKSKKSKFTNILISFILIKIQTKSD